MTDNCTCKPGSNDTGWHEKRCEACLEVDHAIWRDIFERINSGEFYDKPE